MNAEQAEELARHACNGRDVIVLCANNDFASEALRLLQDQYTDEIVGVARTAGQQRIEYRGSTLRILLARGQGIRGRTADVLFLDERVRDMLGADGLAAAVACTAHRGGAVIITDRDSS